jgi:glycosyltransferase involved in cell wall biosynthesis
MNDKDPVLDGAESGPAAPGLTVIIPTYNVSSNIAGQLEHLRGFADEVLVCDSFSTDETVAIARSLGARVVETYVNSARRRTGPFRKPARMGLDSRFDEALEPELKEEIRAFLANVPSDVELAHIPRINLFWGSPMLRPTGYPDYQSRLFRRDRGRYDGREVHSHVTVPGKSVRLEHHLIHNDFTDISSWWLKMNRYFRYELDESLKQGRQWTYRRQFLYPPVLFLRDYFFRGGIGYGFSGFFAAFQKALYYFMVQAKLYEYELERKRPLTKKTSNPF